MQIYWFLLVTIPPECKRLLLWLNTLVCAKQTTQTGISRETTVDQSQVSRILGGNARRYSANVKKLCKYAKFLEQDCQNLGQQGEEQALIDALLNLWDGTPEHALAIKRLLSAIQETQQASLHAVNHVKAENV